MSNKKKTDVIDEERMNPRLQQDLAYELNMPKGAKKHGKTK